MKRNCNLVFYLALATLSLLLISGCTLQKGENSADQPLVEGIAKSTSLVEYITPGSLGSDYLDDIIEDPGFHMYEFYTVMDKLISKTYYISVESESIDSNRMRIRKVNTDGTLGSMNGLSFGQKNDSHLKFAYHRGATFMVLYNSTNGSLTVTVMKTNGLPDTGTGKVRMFFVDPGMTTMDLRAMDSYSSVIVMTQASGTSTSGNNMCIIKLDIDSSLQSAISVKSRYMTSRTGWTNLSLLRNAKEEMILFLYNSNSTYSDMKNVYVYKIGNDYKRSSLFASYEWSNGWDNIQYRELHRYNDDRKFLFLTRNDLDSNGNNVAIIPVENIGEDENDTKYWFDALDKKWDLLEEEQNGRAISFNVGTNSEGSDFLFYCHQYDTTIRYGFTYNHNYSYYGYRVLPRVK